MHSSVGMLPAPANWLTTQRFASWSYNTIGITEAVGLANAAEAGPNSLNIKRAKKGSAGRFIKDLVGPVHHLDILRRTHFAVGVRRSAVTTDPRERDAGKVSIGAGIVGASWPSKVPFCTTRSTPSLWRPAEIFGFSAASCSLHSMDRPRFHVTHRG
jgi:hypothetical protein